MTKRLGPQQRPPRPNLDLESFPSVVLNAGERKFRAHSNRHGGAAGAWNFSTGPGGRFQLDGPKGTCYMADQPRTALWEKLAPELDDMGGLGVELAADLMVTPISLPEDAVVANLDDEDAIQFGVFNELSASAYETYEIPKVWAAAFEAANYAGIRYLSRFPTGHTSASWAAFGPAGPASELPYWADDARPALGTLREMGVTILGEVAAAELTVISPPEWS